MQFCHQACLIKTAYMVSHPYSLKYKIAGDYEFFVRAASHQAIFKHIPILAVIFEKDGISSKQGALVNYEENLVKYRLGLIDKKQGIARLIKARWRMLIRRMTPQWLIDYRHEKIMAEATGTWVAKEEIKYQPK